MTLSELLTLVGLAWSRLLLFPGGAAALAAAWLVARARAASLAKSAAAALAAGDIVALALPWLGLALLPLPFAPPMGRKTDLVVALALLEWPLLRGIKPGAARPRQRAWLAGARWRPG
ncbi:hypothetical protein [Kouleothrix sp.]|uniref:hypothetical protein n=1 Tax=Kouleothrix sp. TaxID=2779161 RepID=UPI003918B087